MMQKHTNILSIHSTVQRIELVSNRGLLLISHRHPLVVAQPQVALTQLEAGEDDLVPARDVALLQRGGELALLPLGGGGAGACWRTRTLARREGRRHSRAALLGQTWTDYYTLLKVFFFQKFTLFRCVLWRSRCTSQKCKTPYAFEKCSSSSVHF